MVSAPAPVDRPTGATNYAMNAARIIAAVLVVVSHIRPLFFVDYSQSDSNDAGTQALYAVTSIGQQAVIVFFVLSGYWVGGSVIKGLSRGTFSASRYAIARVTRLWMVLLPAIVLTQVVDRVGAALAPNSDIYSGSDAYHTVIPVNGPLATLDPVTSLGNILFLQDLHVASLGSNTAMWSLAAEFWYYLLFPAALIVVWRGIPLVARLGSAFVLVGGLLVVALPTQADPTEVMALFPAWILGAIVAWQRTRVSSMLERMPASPLMAVQILAVLAVIGAAIVDSRSGSLPTTYLLSIVTAGLIALLVNDVRSRAAKRALAPLSWSAEWSYSRYATHLPVVALLAAVIVPQASARWQMSPASFVLLLLILLVPIAVGMLFYSFTERHTNTVRSWIVRLTDRKTGAIS